MSLRLFRVLPQLALFALLALNAGCTPKIGNKCTLSTDCSQLGDRLCDTNQPNGYCTIFNCEPDQCPDSVCVAFDPVLDPTCGAATTGRYPRFERSFCLSTCNSDSDCRDQYQCIDLSQAGNQTLRRAQVVDLGAADGGLGFKVCMAATCGDGIQDGVETDVDCGGSACAHCDYGKKCNNADDCNSGYCQGGICIDPSCLDGAKDGSETDKDCGGPQCGPCPGGLGCALDSDCTSKHCVGSTCLPGDCGNHAKDGLETDVDCGGSGCAPCGIGLSCNSATDCSSAYCLGLCTGNATQSCQGDADCTGTAGKCGGMRCRATPPPPVCSVSDAGTDGSVPWTPYAPADAGTD